MARRMGQTGSRSQNISVVQGPSISAPSWQQGQIATCRPGVFHNDPTITYQWLRDAGTVIGSANNSTYTLAVADVGHTVKCRVTAATRQDRQVVETASSPTIS